MDERVLGEGYDALLAGSQEEEQMLLVRRRRVPFASLEDTVLLVFSFRERFVGPLLMLFLSRLPQKWWEVLVPMLSPPLILRIRLYSIPRESSLTSAE